MEIKRIFILTTIIFCCISSEAANTKSAKTAETPKAVVKFTDNVEKLSFLSNEEKEVATRLTEENRTLFPAYPTGINLDMNKYNNSEFLFLELPKAATSATYCRSLYKYIYEEKRLKLSHQILFTVIQYNIDAGGKDVPYIYETTLKKTCRLNNHTKDLWQIFTVSCEDGLITQLRTSENSPEASGNGAQEAEVYETIVKQPHHTNEIQNTKIFTEQQYLNLAARYYTAKDYERAHTTLKKLTEVYDSNAEGWYRLALIVYYKPKWSKTVYSNPIEAAISFMKKASDRATGSLKKKIDNVLQPWEHPNDM